GPGMDCLKFQGSKVMPLPSEPASTEAPVWFGGLHFSISKLVPFLVDFDAAEAGYDLPVPFFVIQGRDDPRTPPDAARAFVSQMRAPAKGYTAIEGGHFRVFHQPYRLFECTSR
ncbi:MAG TPA: alpha/beta hydrolase, partial [Silvibacterium sp.]|nr:alpha/beta hydrolase [Silvibacterium sp.]